MSAAARFRIALAAGCAVIVLASFLPVRPRVAGDGNSPVTHSLPYRRDAAPANWNLEMVVLNLVNTERAAVGLPALMPHSTIRSIARAHGVEMFAAGVLTHRSADGRGPQQRVLNQRVRVRLVGENLAYAPDVYSAHDALMASPAHRHNILAPEYALVGIGVLDAGAHGVIIVQNFADAPASGTSRSLTRAVRRPAAFVPRAGAASGGGSIRVHAERRSLH